MPDDAKRITPAAHTAAERIRAVWCDGMSAAQIAAAIHTTRNTVIGTYNRNPGLRSTHPLGGFKAGGKTKTKDDHKKPAMMKPRMPVAAVPAPPPQVAVTRMPEPESLNVPLEELRDCHCKWPHGPDPAGVTYFCGQARDGLRPYCPAHWARSRGRGTESERTALSGLKKVMA